MKISDLPDEPQIVDSESLFIDPDDGEKSQSFDDFYNTLGDQGPSRAELQQWVAIYLIISKSFFQSSFYLV